MRQASREVSDPLEPSAAPLALVGDALDAPAASLGPQSAVTTVAGRLQRVGAYESYLASRDSERSAQTMREGLERVAKLLGRQPEAVPWHRMTYAETSAIRAALLRANYSLDTVRVTLSALRGVLRQANRLGLMSGNDLAGAINLERIHGKRLPAGRDLSNEEIAKLHAYCVARGPSAVEWPASAYGAFLSATFALLIGAGLRATEASRLTVKGYDPEALELRLLRKGNRETILAVGPDVKPILDAWLPVRAELDAPTEALLVRVQPDGRVRAKSAALNFRALEYLCETISTELGIKRFTPHDCRRTFATRALDAGIDLATVQSLMSHASPDTTVRYDRRGYKKDAEARAKFRLWPST
jgi:integrase